ncbi:MAG: nucleotidyltransferase domain-containing protein [Ruminococcus sp.]|jgi:predicted nucleotidyltransferase
MEKNMTVKIDAWMEAYKSAVEKQFGKRIWFMGLQGSYGRREAGEHSDIDVVLILDNLSPEDLHRYGQLLNDLPYRELVCGFVSGKEELLAWEPSDLFQFYYDTVPVIGSLDILLKRIQKEDILRAIHSGVCNVYHMCVHNMLHEKSGDILRDLYKASGFLLQAIAFYQTGIYKKRKSELLGLLQKEERRILEQGINLKKGKELSEKETALFSSDLMAWSSKWIRYCDSKNKKKS